MLKEIISKLEENLSNITMSWKLEKELSSAHSNNSILFSIHASLSWICVYTGNKNKSKWCASCLISHCHRPRSAVGEDSELAHVRTVILDTWSRCLAREVGGDLIPVTMGTGVKLLVTFLSNWFMNVSWFCLYSHITQELFLFWHSAYNAPNYPV